MASTTVQDKETVKELRELIQASSLPHFKSFSTHPSFNTEEFLLRYIRSRNYDVQSAFERLTNHMYIRRVKNPEIFARLYPSVIYPALEDCGARVLKHRDDKGRGILWVDLGCWDPTSIPVDDFLLAMMLFGWEMLGSVETQLKGVVLLVDGSGFNLKHAKCGTPGNVQKYADLIVRSSPFKCKAAHIVHAPMVFSMTLSLIKMFLPGKLRRRIHLHSSLTTLHDHLSPDILPSSLGGNREDNEVIDMDLHNDLLTEEKDAYYNAFL